MTAQAVSNVRTREQWAEIINADWRRSIESIIQTGRDLAAAHAELPRGEFRKMVEVDLPFSMRAAEKLMAVAAHPRIGNAKAPTRLPPSWSVLAELVSLKPHDFEDAEKRGLIGPGTSMRSARAVTGVYGVPEGGTWGEGGNPEKLPAPSEASKIARETNRMVAASDGHVYSGATEEEGHDHIRRRQQTYGIIDAVNAIANCRANPDDWIDEAEGHWLHSFELGAIDAAIEWLSDLRDALPEKLGVIDGE